MKGISSWRLMVYGVFLLVAGVYVTQSFRSTHTLEVGQIAPQVQLTLPDGQRLDLHKPGQVVLLSFWASWCEPCRKEAPILNALRHKTLVVGISMDDADAQGAELLGKGMGMEFPIVGGRTDLAQTFQVENIPTVYVLAADGTVVFAEAGIAEQSSLEQAIAQASSREI